jgi:hypothetical protein
MAERLEALLNRRAAMVTECPEQDLDAAIDHAADLIRHRRGDVSHENTAGILI